MRFASIILLFTFISHISIAQDSLWIKVSEEKPFITHKSSSNESLFTIAKIYSAPPAQLADVNNIALQQVVAAGKKVDIPVDSYNYIKENNVLKSKPLYYKVKKEDNLIAISRLFKVSQSVIQKWNGLLDTKLNPGKILKVGWVAYDKLSEPKPAVKNAKDASKPFQVRDSIRNAKELPITILDSKEDSVAVDEKPSAYEILYDQQVMSMNITEESGAAVFYDLKMKAPKDVYYAFHNMANKGTILKITNPANGKFIFAKVIGTIPNLKDYHNALIGLSDNAASVLGARDTKMFCNIKYR